MNTTLKPAIESTSFRNSKRIVTKDAEERLNKLGK